MAQQATHILGFPRHSIADGSADVLVPALAGEEVHREPPSTRIERA